MFIVYFVLGCFSNANAQDFSNGNINFIFRPDYHLLQVAVWIENQEGDYIGTVFLTDFIGRRGGGNRTNDPDIDVGNGNRLSALPVWSHKRGVIDTTFGIENYYPPAETEPAYPDDIDAISGATPDRSIQKKAIELSNLPYGKYNCWIEVNQSYDTNSYHNYSYYRGQPSVVWNVTIDVTDNPDSSMILDYTGYGSPDGSDGNINTPDSTITTASDQLLDMGGYRFKVIYVPEVLSSENHLVDPQRINVYYLKNNYPNPFNSETIISYSILKPAQVILKIHDSQGKEVRTLIHKHHEIGDYTLSFDAKNLSKGIYLYTLQIGNKLVCTKKMIFTD